MVKKYNCLYVHSLEKADFCAVFTIWYRIYSARSEQRSFLEVHLLGRHVGFSVGGSRKKWHFPQPDPLQISEVWPHILYSTPSAGYVDSLVEISSAVLGEIKINKFGNNVSRVTLLCERARVIIINYWYTVHLQLSPQLSHHLSDFSQVICHSFLDLTGISISFDIKHQKSPSTYNKYFIMTYLWNTTSPKLHVNL